MMCVYDFYSLFQGHEGAIHAVSPSPFDENILATGGVDGRFQLWNISNLRRYEQHKKQYDEESHLFAETTTTGGLASSIEQPLLFHHRFPPSELDVTQGLVWRFNDPTDDQPIWPRGIPNPFIRRNTREQSGLMVVDQTTNTTSENITGTGSTSYTSNHSSSLRTLTESRSSTSGTRGGGGGGATNSNTKLQRITACRVLPTAEGVGFLVVTKSGVMSLFSPSEESTSYTSQIIHAPSGVPFHRLPPGYLTNFRGFPYPSRRQKQIPGRSHLVEPLDLLPSVTLDEETDEDIVVDDIQFCSNIPPDYCPLPQLSNNEPVHGKTYLWCSPWLTNQTPLIESFEGEELNLKIAEQNRKYEEERNFFCAGGEPVVSFGDDFTASKNSTEQIIIMQPEGNCFHRSQISSSQKLLSPTSSKTSQPKINNTPNSCDILKHEISDDEKQLADENVSNVTTTIITNISSDQIDETAGCPVLPSGFLSDCDQTCMQNFISKYGREWTFFGLSVGASFTTSSNVP
ncbi:unnamed protein product [Trichobilharzia regenti]|nr:unnamed protein product [Trichobilharzia regenti]